MNTVLNVLKFCTTERVVKKTYLNCQYRKGERQLYKCDLGFLFSLMCRLASESDQLPYFVATFNAFPDTLHVVPRHRSDTRPPLTVNQSWTLSYIIRDRQIHTTRNLVEVGLSTIFLCISNSACFFFFFFNTTQYSVSHNKKLYYLLLQRRVSAYHWAIIRPSRNL